MRQTAIKEVYKAKQPIQVIPLYIGTCFQDNYDLGPILVAALNGSHLITQIQQDWADSATILQTDQSLQTVAEHLKQFITVTDDSGSNALFRFADPLTTWYWLNSYHGNIPLDIFGPIKTWQVSNPIPDWQQPQTAQWQIFAPLPEATFTHIRLDYLNEPQVQALDQAADFRFKNKLYQWLQTERADILQSKTAEQISQWFELAMVKVNTYNLTNQRTIAQWVDLCTDYGLDFISQENSPYQQWLQQNSQYKSLPIDIKIQHFYDYTIELS